MSKKEAGTFDTDDFEESLANAKKYDEMIPWKARLAREIPVIHQKFSEDRDPGFVLDIACSSGRHSFALEDHGYHTIGIDISKGMIHIASEHAKSTKSANTFLQVDASNPDLDLELAKSMELKDTPVYFDHALLLGNAIANMGSFSTGKQLIGNIFRLLKPGGRLFMQTVQRPMNPHYLPLRKTQDGLLVQRIMIPVVGDTNSVSRDDKSSENKEIGGSADEFNVALHFNQIDIQSGKYEELNPNNRLYMYTYEEMKRLLEYAGFEILECYSNYQMDAVVEEDGATILWVVKKPQIPIYEETRKLFNNYAKLDEAEIRQNTLKIWQKASKIQFYRCITSYRFLYPRITSHPNYQSINFDEIEGKIIDLACFMGTDIRQMIVDGANPAQLIGIDLSSEFIEFGKQIFQDSDRLESKFYALDLIIPNIVDTNLNELKQQAEIVHAGSLLHLLAEEQVIQLFENVVELLQPSGIFFGRTVGSQQPVNMNNPGGLQHLHSKESLEQRLKSYDFEEIEVSIATGTTPVGERSQGSTLSLMFFAKYVGKIK